MEKLTKFILAVVTLLAVLAFFLLLKRSSAPKEEIVANMGPVTIRDIAKTEQLKVLSAHKEILASMHRVKSGLLKDSEDKIYVIYPATLHFGFDLSECDTSSIQTMGDTVLVKLPPVKILNKDGKSVDEAAKRTAIEEGTWSAQEMTELRGRAEALMRRYCEYDSCYARAEKTGKSMVRTMLLSLGYGHVEVEVMPRADYGLCLMKQSVRNMMKYRFYKKDKLHYLLYNVANAQKEARLYYSPGNLSERELLAVGDCFMPFMAAEPRNARILVRDKGVFVMLANNQVDKGSKEAEKIIHQAKGRNMAKIKEVLKKLVFANKKPVYVVEVDKNGHIIYQYQ